MLRRALLALAALVAAWLVACAVLFVWPPAETGAPARADVVVVLSGARERLPAAERLIRGGVAPLLALSSVSRTPKLKAERRLCRAGSYRGVPVLCFDAVPFSTRGEAETVARLARERGWGRIVVVSSTFHLTRAKLLFDRCWHGRLWLVGSSIPWWRLPAEWAVETGKLLVQVTSDRGC